MPNALSNTFLRARIKMRHLLLLVAIDDTRSVHKAADAMHITQPAATKLLGDIERSLGLRLFDRTTRGLTPTSAGASLVRHARMVLANLHHAQAELEALASGASGKIVVGVLLAAAAVLLPRGIARLKAVHPRTTVQITEGNLDTLIPALRAGTLDVVIGRLSDDIDSAGLEYEVLYEEPMWVVTRVGHPLSRRKGLRLTDLCALPWIVPPPGMPYRLRLDAAFRRGGAEPPDDLVESTCILANKTLLQETDRVGVMPADVARHYETLGLLRTLDVAVPPPSGPVGAILEKGRSRSTALDALLDGLRAIAGEQVARVAAGER